MKRIIDGTSYNTDTATEVFSQSASEPSMGWWALYQTRHGAFFKVVVDHDGETATWTPLSDADAQALLEKCANHLVERYFEPTPGSSGPERRLTIRIPDNLADRVEAVAKEKGFVSLNSYAMRCFEKASAVECLATVLTTFERSGREPDWWESEHLTDGIGALFRGQYSMALCCADLALVPKKERSPDARPTRAERFGLPQLRKAFGAAAAEPLRKFPHFGPIVFGAGE
jgi:hypothetical protein